ncbi:trans-aconitate 2-methyltransferase [Thioclava sp. SK-1]|uniref:class I SAM-dependent methyltransferase n=1 Tax=Thioclava sp. SK-1 TaxID=1889770 RepID=UPI003513FF38
MTEGGSNLGENTGSVLSDNQQDSVFEVGCGAGFASAFLQSEIAGVSVGGIDAAPNLVEIASELTGAEFVCGNYLDTEGRPENDLVICDFGFDLANFHPSRKPHGTAVAGQYEYCLGCSEDFVPQFAPYFAAWKAWMRPTGRLAVVGRFQNVGMVLAAGRAAASCGLGLVDDLSTKLKVDTPVGKQAFPALVFEGSFEPTFTPEDAARVYAR